MEMQQFYYDNKIVKKFLYATLLWGIVGFSVGLLLAFMFLFPNLTDDISWLSFGRLRPLHTNAYYCRRCNYFTFRIYNFKRICRIRMANWYCNCFGLGCIWCKYDLDHLKKKTKTFICCCLVLFRNICYSCSIAYF